MNVKYKIKLGVFVLLGMTNASSVFAKSNLVLSEGGHSGNGGRSIVCIDAGGGITSAELLDIYEGRNTRQINSNPVLDHLDREQIFEEISKRLNEIDPVEADSINRRVKSFLIDIDSLEQSPFAPSKNVLFLEDRASAVDDSYELFIPKHCAVEQFVIQKMPVFPEDKLINIQKDIWLKMKPLHQVATLYHEAFLYRAVNDYHMTNSVGTRYIISKLFSERLMTRLDYEKLSAAGGVYIRPTQAEISVPSMYQWSTIPDNFKRIARMLSVGGSTYEKVLGKCILEAYDGHYDTYVIRSKILTITDLSGSWEDTAKRLQQGICD